MADDREPRAVLIPPLRAGRIELVRERPKRREQPQHPHCDEHFLFTPHCAACVEAERHQRPTVQAESTQRAASQKPQSKLVSSRSFGFDDSITPDAVAELVYQREVKCMIVEEVVETVVGAVISLMDGDLE